MAYHSVFRPGLFAGQIIIVTGSGSGIGRCIAHELVSLGATVALIGRKLDKLEKVRGEIVAAGGQASCHSCDIRDEPSVQATVAAVLKTHGAIHALVNNAGGQFVAQLKNISAKGWEAVVKNNLTGGFLFARECYNQRMSEHGGAIVNIIADMWGGMPTMGHSGAARAGMLSFTETAACEWAHSGVRINAVAPGWIGSSGMDTYPPELHERVRNFKFHLPMQRVGTEAEVSAAIVFLLSEAAAFITGACLYVNGGAHTARHPWKLIAHERSKPYNGFPLATIPKLLS
ncbi:MAG: SDR family oxidoreductase [Betaproteobacteria bacterium]|nr:MAG: SDR family oxidoreductase [Betaproteobacteria bacterium]